MKNSRHLHYLHDAKFVILTDILSYQKGDSKFFYSVFYFDTALFWFYEGQSHEVNIATQSYFQRSFWWAFKKYGICNHLRENWEPLKKWVHFPWTLRLLEPFQVDFRQKPFLIRFSTFIWPGYHEIILEFGQLY